MTALISFSQLEDNTLVFMLKSCVLFVILFIFVVAVIELCLLIILEKKDPHPLWLKHSLVRKPF